jgi:ABC-type multidrug transport system fused ATPase/permease subunit
VLEQGDHASLMAARGIYRDLFDSQFATHVA